MRSYLSVFFSPLLVLDFLPVVSCFYVINHYGAYFKESYKICFYLGRKIFIKWKKKSEGMVQRRFTEAENFVSLFAVWLRVCKFRKRIKLCQNQLLS